MAKPRLIALGVLSIGAGVGFALGNNYVALVWAAVCLVVGIVILVAPEARGAKLVAAVAQPGQKARPQAQLLVLVKDVHARPLKNGKLQEIGDPDEPGLEFEVFVNCWLVNETDFLVSINGDLRLGIVKNNGSMQYAERIAADLDHWRLGGLVRSGDSNQLVSRVKQEEITELHTAEPLECGVPRQGWLHFRLRDITPDEFRIGVLELEVQDSTSSTHVGRATSPRHLPGRIWPHVPVKAATVAGGMKGSGAESQPMTTVQTVVESSGSEDGIPYYWVVVCKNRGFHEHENIYSGHKIALCETDAYESPPLVETFAVRCEECGEELTYNATDLVRFQMAGVATLKPHPSFL